MGCYKKQHSPRNSKLPKRIKDPSYHREYSENFFNGSIPLFMIKYYSIFYLMCQALIFSILAAHGTSAMIAKTRARITQIPSTMLKI